MAHRIPDDRPPDLVPVSTDDVELVTVTPRVLAGPGEPGTALKPLDDAGWHRSDDPDDNSHAWSPDELQHAAFVPEGADVVGGLHTLWLAHEYRPTRGNRRPSRLSRLGPTWTAAFSDNVPAELVAGFFAKLADPDLPAQPLPRRVAGAAWKVLEAIGWETEHDPQGNAHAVSPDHLVRVSDLPEGDAPAGRLGAQRIRWLLRANCEPGKDTAAAPVWVAAGQRPHTGCPAGRVPCRGGRSGRDPPRPAGARNHA